MSKSRFPKPVVKVSKKTGKVEARYQTLRAASLAEGVALGTISSQCTNKTLPPGPSYFRFESEYDRFEELGGKRNCPVICNGSYYNSVKEAAEGEGLSCRFLNGVAKGSVKSNKVRIWWS